MLLNVASSFLSVLVKDQSLQWMLGKSQIYYPKYILGYGRREDLLLSCHEFRLFLDRLLGVGIRWRSKHHTETRSQVLGAWSPSLDEDLDPLIGVEWVGLICGWGTSDACVSGYPAGIHCFVNRRFYETVRLGYGLTP